MSQFDVLTGPMLVGTQVNWALLGTLALQVYKFHICFPRETAAIKALVYTIFLLECVQTGITSHFAYSILITRWGDPSVFVKLPWSVSDMLRYKLTLSYITDLLPFVVTGRSLITVP
ncbi:hypothetical protein DFH09DRAFT_307289 [Mycena vulgaris]|nr:hypothetical protein DFH09DRAFT_307289 [Mycena vulgaris]